jgi:voltage-gated sodium channel
MHKMLTFFTSHLNLQKRDMYENGQTDVDYFSRLDKTMLTLFQLMTLDGWDVVVRQVMQTYSWSWIPFLTYITLTGIVVTNIVIAVICDSILCTSKDEEEEQQKKGNDDLHVQIQMMQEQAMHLRVLLETTLLPIGDEFARSESSIRLFHSGTADTDMEQLSEGNQSINSTGNENFRANNGDHDKVEKPTGFRGKCGEFVNGKHVQILIMVLIITNSIMMAVGTFDFVNNNPAVLNAFDTVDATFLTIYSVESILQVIYHGIHIYKDGWASFDLFLVLASWILSFTAIPIQAARSLRIVRVLRIVPKLKSLKNIITAVVRVFPNIGGIGGILFLFFYIFAIIFTELYKDKPLDKYEGYFSRLDTTMFTLFQVMTMVDWTAIARELWEHSYLAPALMSSFIILSGFIFLNLIVALICGAMESIHESVHDMDVWETMESAPTKNVRNINLGRLRNIEDSQKKMLHLLEMCTIAKDEKEGLGIVKGEPSMPPNCKDPERCPDTSS